MAFGTLSNQKQIHAWDQGILEWLNIQEIWKRLQHMPSHIACDLTEYIHYHIRDSFLTLLQSENSNTRSEHQPSRARCKCRSTAGLSCRRWSRSRCHRRVRARDLDHGGERGVRGVASRLDLGGVVWDPAGRMWLRSVAGVPSSSWRRIAGGDHHGRGRWCSAAGSLTTVVSRAAVLLVVGDAELCGILILTRRVDDELDAISSIAIAVLQVVFGNPDEVAGIGVVLDDGVLRLRIRLRALQKDESDGAIGSWVPGD